MLAAGFENIPGAEDIRFKGRNRVAVCYADNRLCAEMKDSVDLILAKRAFNHSQVLKRAPHDIHFLDMFSLIKIGLRHMIPDKPRNICALIDQLFHQIAS